MSDEWTKRCGGGARYHIGYLPNLSATNEGVVQNIEGYVECAEDLLRSEAWGVSLGLQFADTEGEFLPDGSGGPRNSLWTVQFNWTATERAFGEGARTWYRLSSEGMRLGFGEMTTDPAPHDVAGKVIDRPTETFPVMAFGRFAANGIAWEPAEHFMTSVEGGFGTYNLWSLGDAEHGQFSRPNLLLFLGIRGGYTDNMSEQDSLGRASNSSIIRSNIDKAFSFGEAMVLDQEATGAADRSNELLEAAHLKGEVPSRELADLPALSVVQGYLVGTDAPTFFASPAWGRWLGLSGDGAFAVSGFATGMNGEGFTGLFAAGSKMPWVFTIEDAPDGTITNLPEPTVEFATAVTPASAVVAVTSFIPPGLSGIVDDLGSAAFTHLISRFKEPDAMDSGAVMSLTTGVPSFGSVFAGTDFGSASRGSFGMALRLTWMGEHLELRANLATPFLEAEDLVQVLDWKNGQPDDIYKAPSSNRIEASAVKDLVKSDDGMIEVRGGIHAARSYDLDNEGSNAIGAQVGIGGYFCPAKSFCMGTELSLYGSLNVNGDGEVNLTGEIPYPTLNLRFLED